MSLSVPTLPPLVDTLDQVQRLFLPSAGAAALVFGVLALSGSRLRPWAAAVALIVGVLAGNWASTPFTLEQWQEPTAPRFYLPKFALCLLVLGCVFTTISDLIKHRTRQTRIIVEVITQAARALALAFGATYVLPAEVGNPFIALFVVASLLLWFTLDQVSLTGSGAEVGLIVYLTCATVGGVMLFAHYASFMDFSMIVGMAFLGLAIIAAHGGYDLRGAIPGFIGFMPGLIVSGKLLTESETPASCFWLAPLLPLLCLPALIPWVSRKLGRTAILVRVGLVMTVSLFILGWAAQYEKLPWEVEW